MKINKTKTAKEIDPAKKANLRKFVTGINEEIFWQHFESKNLCSQ